MPLKLLAVGLRPTTEHATLPQTGLAAFPPGMAASLPSNVQDPRTLLANVLEGTAAQKERKNEKAGAETALMRSLNELAELHGVTLAEVHEQLLFQQANRWQSLHAAFRMIGQAPSWSEIRLYCSKSIEDALTKMFPKNVIKSAVAENTFVVSERSGWWIFKKQKPIVTVTIQKKESRHGFVGYHSLYSYNDPVTADPDNHKIMLHFHDTAKFPALAPLIAQLKAQFAETATVEVELEKI